MNEIENAIEHFHYGITHDIFSEPVTTYARLAIDALREKLERSKGCPVCDGKYADERVSDRYCNCCGRRLEVER